MSLRKLTRSEWREYCDRVSRGAAGRRAELEVVALGLGDHVQARWLPLIGITYDAKSDVIEVALEGVDHLIAQPRDVYVEETDRGLVGVQVAAADESRQIMKLREPLLLPTQAAAQRAQTTPDAETPSDGARDGEQRAAYP